MARPRPEERVAIALVVTPGSGRHREALRHEALEAGVALAVGDIFELQRGAVRAVNLVRATKISHRRYRRHRCEMTIGLGSYYVASRLLDQHVGAGLGRPTEALARIDAVSDRCGRDRPGRSRFGRVGSLTFLMQGEHDRSPSSVSSKTATFVDSSLASWARTSQDDSVSGQTSVSAIRTCFMIASSDFRTGSVELQVVMAPCSAVCSVCRHPFGLEHQDVCAPLTLVSDVLIPDTSPVEGEDQRTNDAQRTSKAPPDRCTPGPWSGAIALPLCIRSTTNWPGRTR